MRSRSFMFSALLLATFAVSACGSSGSPPPKGQDGGGGAGGAGGAASGPGKALHVDKRGGVILVRAMPEGFGFDVHLYASMTPEALPPLTIGDGHCDVGSPWMSPFLPPWLPDPIEATDLDLGPTVTADGPLGSFQATPESAMSFDYLYGQAFADPPYGSTWTISNAGSASGLPAGLLATVKLPGKIDLGNTSELLITPGEAVEATFSGGAGADTIHMHIQGTSGSADCYPPPGATSFVIPAEITSAVGAHATIYLFAEKVDVVTIGGRDVLVVGETDNLD